MGPRSRSGRRVARGPEDGDLTLNVATKIFGSVTSGLVLGLAIIRCASLAEAARPAAVVAPTTAPPSALPSATVSPVTSSPTPISSSSPKFLRRCLQCRARIARSFRGRAPVQRRPRRGPDGATHDSVPSSRTHKPWVAVDVARTRGAGVSLATPKVGRDSRTRWLVRSDCPNLSKVHGKGVEPLRLAAAEPKSAASASFATRARECRRNSRAIVALGSASASSGASAKGQRGERPNET